MEENSCAANVQRQPGRDVGRLPDPGHHAAQSRRDLGIPVENVLYHCVPGGGAFGRHLFHDQEVQAAQVSKRIGKPVKLQWMREEGIKHGRCRPVSLHKVKAVDQQRGRGRLGAPHGLPGDGRPARLRRRRLRLRHRVQQRRRRPVHLRPHPEAGLQDRPDVHHAEAAAAGQAHRGLAGRVLRPGRGGQRDHDRRGGPPPRQGRARLPAEHARDPHGTRPCWRSAPRKRSGAASSRPEWPRASACTTSTSRSSPTSWKSTRAARNLG